MSPILVAHVSAGGVALLTGFIALYATKGAPVHRRFGLGFVIAMVAMTVLAQIYMAVEGRIILGNVLASSICAYLVLTSLMTVREPSKAAGTRRAIALGSAAMALAIAVFGLYLGRLATQLPRGLLQGLPAFPYFLFGTIGLLSFIGDVRMSHAGGAYTGPKRLTRHLWRMTFALLIAAMSFFLGQADEFPKALRILPIMVGPPLAVLVTLLYWMWRVRLRRRLEGFIQGNAWTRQQEAISAAVR
jgi:hypothetical protein